MLEVAQIGDLHNSCISAIALGQTHAKDSLLLARKVYPEDLVGPSLMVCKIGLNCFKGLFLRTMRGQKDLVSEIRHHDHIMILPEFACSDPIL